ASRSTLARARGAAYGAHDDLRDSVGRARHCPFTVTAGSGISAPPHPSRCGWAARPSPFTSGDRLSNQEDEFSVHHRSGHLPDAVGWSFRTTEPAVILSSFLMYGKVRHSSRNLDFNTAGDGRLLTPSHEG